MTFAEYCEKNNRLKLLELYDNEKSAKTAFEISYSSGKQCYSKCPDCGRERETSPNRLIRLAEKNYNYFKKTESVTYCVACGGKVASSFYNLKLMVPEIDDYYDYSSNVLKPEDYTPRSTKRIVIKCNKNNCDYKNDVRVKDFVRGINAYKCPCQGGKNKKATAQYNLTKIAPHIGKEFDIRLNGGETAVQVLPSLNEKKWFTCSVCDHSYEARVSNRVYLKRGCPKCNERNQTSFIEQMFRFYIKKCGLNTQSRIIDTYTNLEIDIFLPDQLLAIEYKSKYYYEKASFERKETYARKLMKLTKYYRVISLQEYENICVDDMIDCYVLPTFGHNKLSYQVYNNIVRELLVKIAPNLIFYPRIDIERDSLEILQQYIDPKTKIKNSFEETHPEYIKSWDNDMNGNLKPSMFRAGNSDFKFYWKCLNCKNKFSSFIWNRKRISYDKCPKCNNAKSNNKSVNEYINIIRPFWNEKMNKVRIEDLSYYSEKIIILCLYDGRCVPVRCYNVFSFIENNPNIPLEVYLKKRFEKRHRSENLIMQKF